MKTIFFHKMIYEDLKDDCGIVSVEISAVKRINEYNL